MITRRPDGKFETPIGVFNTMGEAQAAMSQAAGQAQMIGARAAPAPTFKRLGEHPLYGPNPENMPAPALSALDYPSSAQMPANTVPNPPQPRGLLDRLKADFSGMNQQDALMALGSTMLGLSQDPNLQQMGMGGFGQIKQNRDTRTALAMKNKTVQALRDANRDDLADAVESGMMPAADAAKILFDKNKPYSSVGKLQADLAAGRINEEQYKIGLNALENAGKTIFQGGINETELQKTLGKKRAETISKYFGAADNAAVLAGDIDTLQALMEMSPNGPITGRFLEMFPEATTASAAFRAMVTRMAPTLRVEGSGSTSDLEFNAMLNSLGSLKNTPEANRLIYDAFRRKIDIDLKRGEIAGQLEREEIDYRTASRKWAELNRESYLSSELKAMIPDTKVSIEQFQQTGMPAEYGNWYLTLTPEQATLFNEMYASNPDKVRRFYEAWRAEALGQ